MGDRSRVGVPLLADQRSVEISLRLIVAFRDLRDAVGGVNHGPELPARRFRDEWETDANSGRKQRVRCLNARYKLPADDPISFI